MCLLTPLGPLGQKDFYWYCKLYKSLQGLYCYCIKSCVVYYLKGTINVYFLSKGSLYKKGLRIFKMSIYLHMLKYMVWHSVLSKRPSSIRPCYHKVFLTRLPDPWVKIFPFKGKYIQRALYIWSGNAFPF